MSTVDLSSAYSVGRRLSGSSSKVSLRDEDMESLDFNINDISRASSPASISAKSEGHLHRDRRHRHSFRGDEDYRRRYNRLKSELELERSKIKTMNKDKIEEMRQIREFYENERRQEHAAIQKRFEEEKKKEVVRLKEEMIKQKDYELQQVLKYKEEEIKYYRSHTPRSGTKTPVSERSRTPVAGVQTPRTPRTTDRPVSPESREGARPGTGRQTPGLDSITDEIIRASRTLERAKTPSERTRTPERSRTPGGGRMTPMVSREEDRVGRRDSSRVQQMEEDIARLTKEKEELAIKYKDKCKIEDKKDREMKTMKEEYDNELRRVIGEYKKVALGNLQKLKIAEHALREGSMKEDDVLQIPLGNPQNVHIRRMSVTSPTSTESGTAPESGDEGSKREEREKEKALQKKVGELQTQTQRLERRVMLLRTENDGLKKKQEDHKPLEEKVKTLKKRNAELAAIARRLEEKAKALQQENAKNKTKTKEEVGVATADGDHLKRLFARQRAKDLAEHAKNMLTKDREIEELRKKCQELADQLSNGDVMAPQNVQIYEEKEELVNIVKQAAKERLQLEQQLAHSKTKERTQNDDQEREKQRRELEAANDILHKEIEKLETALKQTETLKEDLSQKGVECETLTSNLVRLKEQNVELEEELQTSSAKNTEYAVQVDSLEERLKDFDQVKEECSTLRVTLAAAETDRETAKEQVSSLQTRVYSLENLVRDLQESAEQLQTLEHDYKNALSQLAAKQTQIDLLQEAQEKSKVEQEKSVTKLQNQIRELETKCQTQEQRQEDLNQELQTLRTQKSDLDHLLKQQEEQQYRQSSSRRHGSPVITGGIPPSDSADSGLPASGANSDEGIGHAGQGSGGEGHPVLDISTAPDTPSKSHDTDPEDSAMDRHKDRRSDQFLSDNRLSALANRGPIEVYVAKYSYNPFEYSPNENPEAELHLNAGDYVLVLGDMDEDGFFEGELIDGKRGLVPSNFIERVADEDLGEFHAALALSGTNDDSSSKPDPSPMDSDGEDVGDGSFGINGRVSKNLLNNNNNAEEAPGPQQLVLDRQLTTSVMISWRPPQGLSPASIQAYHVYVNGALKATLKGSERTKALLEDVDASQNHRISVRCLSTQGQSKESQCTMLIGRDVLPVPMDVSVHNVTQSSACIHWMPGNSNHPHAILLNGREAKCVKPGVCSHTLTGLAPSTVYRVTIATRPVSGTFSDKQKWSQDKMSCNIEFKTLVGGAVPDPPLNVQVEAGPREGTLLLTWLPVTINSSGFSNGAVVTGYVVYADGNRIKEAKGPTNDHLVLGKEDFKGYVPKQLTLRTATVDQLESSDSGSVHLPHNLVKEVTVATARSMASEAVRAVNLRKSPKVAALVSGEHAGHDTDEEIEAAFQETETSSPETETQMAEPFAESTSSELSDILEVEEEVGGEEANQNADTSVASLPSQAEKPRKSPKPASRKSSLTGQGSSDKGAEFSVKQFHGQKPDPSKKDGLLATPMIVPAIEITRDSSTERGGSFEDDTDASSHRPTPTDTTTIKRQQQQQQRQKSLEDGVEKPLPVRDPVTQRYRSSGDEPSAFRTVEQGKTRAASAGSHSPEKPRDSTSRSPTQRPGSGQRPSSTHSTPSRKTKDDFHDDKLSENPPPKPVRRTPSESEDVNDKDSITEEMTGVIDDSTVRLFIALFDYDPVTMSPNVDCVEEELPFREGQILKVYGDKDADGFYRGEADGRVGFIPCNMVSEIHIDDPELVEQLLKESQSTVQQSNSTDGKHKGEGHLTPNGVAPLPGPVRRMVALYDYDPQELSPNVDSELELAFKQGDIIFIAGEMDEDGFYAGELSGMRGLVPSNFLQDAPLSDEDEVLESASMVSPSRSQGSISAASRHSDSLSTLNHVGDGGGDGSGGGGALSPALHASGGGGPPHPLPPSHSTTTSAVLTSHPSPAGASPDVSQRSPVTVSPRGASHSPGRAQRSRSGGGGRETQEKRWTLE